MPRSARFQSLLAFLLANVIAVLSQSWSTNPFNPPALPLAVRSPYLNLWSPQGENAVAVNEAWPQFWTMGADNNGSGAATNVSVLRSETSLLEESLAANFLIITLCCIARTLYRSTAKFLSTGFRIVSWEDPRLKMILQQNKRRWYSPPPELHSSSKPVPPKSMQRS